MCIYICLHVYTGYREIQTKGKGIGSGSGGVKRWVLLNMWSSGKACQLRWHGNRNLKEVRRSFAGIWGEVCYEHKELRENRLWASSILGIFQKQQAGHWAWSVMRDGEDGDLATPVTSWLLLCDGEPWGRGDMSGAQFHKITLAAVLRVYYKKRDQLKVILIILVRWWFKTKVMVEKSCVENSGILGIFWT